MITQNFPAMVLGQSFAQTRKMIFRPRHFASFGLPLSQYPGCSVKVHQQNFAGSWDRPPACARTSRGCHCNSLQPDPRMHGRLI